MNAILNEKSKQIAANISVSDYLFQILLYLLILSEPVLSCVSSARRFPPSLHKT